MSEDDLEWQNLLKDAVKIKFKILKCAVIENIFIYVEVFASFSVLLRKLVKEPGVRYPTVSCVCINSSWAYYIFFLNHGQNLLIFFFFFFNPENPSNKAGSDL